MAEKLGQHAHIRQVFRACFCNSDGSLHPAGREAIAFLKQTANYGGSPFSSDALVMAHNVGQQDVVKHILRWLSITELEAHQLDQPQSEIDAANEGYFQ